MNITITTDPLPDDPAAREKRLWVNEERTILVRLWDNGVMETAVRETSDHIWGPPVRLIEEGTADDLARRLARRLSRPA